MSDIVTSLVNFAILGGVVWFVVRQVATAGRRRGGRVAARLGLEYFGRPSGGATTWIDDVARTLDLYQPRVDWHAAGHSGSTSIEIGECIPNQRRSGTHKFRAKPWRHQTVVRLPGAARGVPDLLVAPKDYATIGNECGDFVARPWPDSFLAAYRVRSRDDGAAEHVSPAVVAVLAQDPSLWVRVVSGDLMVWRFGEIVDVNGIDALVKHALALRDGFSARA